MQTVSDRLYPGPIITSSNPSASPQKLNNSLSTKRQFSVQSVGDLAEKEHEEWVKYQSSAVSLQSVAHKVLAQKSPSSAIRINQDLQSQFEAELVGEDECAN